MAEIKNYYFGPNEVKNFATEVLKKVNVRISDKITSNYDSADTSNALSGKGLNNALKVLSDRIDGLTHLHIETVVGEITSVTNPTNDVLYFQKDSDDDPTWVLYIYNTEYENPWIVVGDISIDLVNYWKKTEVEELKTGLGIVDHDVMTTDQISSIFNSLFEDPNAKYFTFAELDDGTYSVTGLSDEGKTLTEITIPAMYKGKAVTTIGKKAFFICSKLISVNIPDSVISIEQQAFDGCLDLELDNIPDSVTNIGDFAFQDCHEFTSFTLPDNIANIGKYAFYYCIKLASLIYRGTTYTSKSAIINALRNNGATVSDKAFVETKLSE